MTSVSFQEKPFPYDYKQYMSWRAGDENTIKSLTAICGNLGRGEDTYINQKNINKNYSEVRYAVHLVMDKSFPKEYIIFENFRLSLERTNQLIRGKGVQAIGARLIKDVFSSTFLQKFDELCDLNNDKFKLIRKICKETHVDLCAINLKTREMRFCEIKRFELGCKPTEKFGDHQKLLLGFVRYAVDSLGEKAFVNRKYKVITELIALVPKEDCSTFIPTKHEIKFAV